MISMHIANFQTESGPGSLTLRPGGITLIAGPNGVGKSALLYTLFRSLPQGTASYLPGHRQIYFNNGWDSLQQDPAQLLLNLYSHFDAFNRYKGAWAEDQFKSVIRRILNSENAFNREFKKSIDEHNNDYIEIAKLRSSPIDNLNTIFASAGFSVRFYLSDDGITADRAGDTYAIDALSDGERAALFLACAIITQPSNTVLLIDEPEKHLHPSITGVLIETGLRVRSDICMVMASHDVTLLETLKVDTIVHVKNSRVVSLRPETRIYDVAYIISSEHVSDELRRDILGSRSRILFIEGRHNSRDIALYRHVYPEWKIVPKGSNVKVIESVKSLRTLGGYHWLAPQGIIDKDGKLLEEVDSLRGQGVHALPCPQVENLFFLPEARRCFIEASLAMKGGISAEEREAELRRVLGDLLDEVEGHIVARRTCWAVHRVLGNQGFSVKDALSPGYGTITVDTDEIRRIIQSEVHEIISSSDVDRILFELPIKSTDICDAAARALGAKSFVEYIEVILRQLDIGSSISLKLASKLRGVLPQIDLPQHGFAAEYRSMDRISITFDAPTLPRVS